MKYPDDPFNPPDAEVPEYEFIDTPFTEQISDEQTELRLEFARWLFTKKWKLKTRNQALRFVTLLMKEEVIRADIRERISPADQPEFDRWISICLGEQLPSTSERERVYESIVDKILQKLKQYQIPIPSNIDDFILKIATLRDVRQKLTLELSSKEKFSVSVWCQQLLKNEKERLNEKIQ